MSTDWRTYGDMPLAAFEAELTRMASPMSIEAREVHAAVSGHSRLFLAMAFHETKMGTLFTVAGIDASFRNPVALMRDGAYLSFPTWRQAAEEWMNRLVTNAATYKGGVYARTTTLEDLIHVYAPKEAGNDEITYATVVRERLAAYGYKEHTMASKPKILLTRGHGTVGDTGAFAANHSEEDHNKRIVPAIAQVLRSAGYDVTTFPADPTQEAPGTLDTEGRFAHDWMAALGGVDGVMIDCHLESSSASGIFAIVPNLAHLITGAGVRQLPQDQWANNVGDRKLGKAICTEINRRTGIPIRTGFVREPGLMSEDMTFVGMGGNGAFAPSRLAMFGYTSPFCDTVYRLVVEFGALQSDAAFFTRADFPANCGAGILAAFGQVFGEVEGSEPVPFEPIPEKVVHAFGGAIVRVRPELSARVKVTYRKPTALRIVGRAEGDEAGHTNEWFVIKSKGPSNKGFIHASGLDRRETA